MVINRKKNKFLEKLNKVSIYKYWTSLRKRNMPSYRDQEKLNKIDTNNLIRTLNPYALVF